MGMATCPRYGSLVLVVMDGLVWIKCILIEHVKTPPCLCGDVGMTVVVRPIYVGLNSEKIFVLLFVESE